MVADVIDIAGRTHKIAGSTHSIARSTSLIETLTTAMHVSSTCSGDDQCGAHAAWISVGGEECSVREEHSLEHGAERMRWCVNKHVHATLNGQDNDENNMRRDHAQRGKNEGEGKNWGSKDEGDGEGTNGGSKDGDGVNRRRRPRAEPCESSGSGS